MLSALLPLPGTHGAVAAQAVDGGQSDVPLVALAVWSTVCDPHMCMNISYRVLSLSAFSRETFEGYIFKMVRVGPPWFGRDRRLW